MADVREKQGTPLGSLFPFIRDLRDQSKFSMSFLNDEFTDIEEWKAQTRAKLWELIPEKVEPCDFNAEIVESVDKGDYIREKVYFNTTQVTRVPAYVLIPKNVEYPAPGLVCLHDHGAMFYWGKEKLVETENEHPSLTEFKQYYSGRSYATEYCKAGYVVIVVDAFYWGERRLITDEDIEKGINDRSIVEPPEIIRHVNAQSLTNEEIVARALYELGITWSGIWIRDEIRSLDYLLTRPEVDPNRIGCVGLSVGGLRSAQFVCMEPRIKCAVVDGWMTTYGEMFHFHPWNVGFYQFITGAYSLVDLPDQASLCCPGGLMVIHGTRDGLFPEKGVADAFEKIQAVYNKAGVPDNVNLRYYDAPHEFNIEQQADALDWLDRWLK